MTRKASSGHSSIYRRLSIATLLLALPAMAAAAWQTISSDQGKRIEIDRSSINKDASGKSEALGRIVLDKPINDPKTASSYLIIEALSRYDCSARSYITLKRSYFKAEGELLRQEEVKTQIELPVRTGTLDDKLLREVCRPKPGPEAAAAASKVAEQIGAAANDLRKANNELVQKNAQRPEAVKPPSEKADAKSDTKAKTAPAAIPTSAHGSAHPATPEKTAKPLAPAPEGAHAAPLAASRPRPVKRNPAVEHPAESHAHIHWSYEGEGGPEHWAQLQPDYASCASGQRQSPIDIQEGIRVDLEPIKFSYRPSQFRIVDNGHTVQVAVGGSSISLLGKTYELLQFHFHRPSEERVNGNPFEMVIHLVHKSEDGKLAVVAVLINKGKEHPVIQKLWNNLPLEKNEEVTPPGLTIDVAQLLPENRSYYTYMGSLTTPPCSEGVLWLVLKQAQQFSPEQLAIFSRLYNNNTRPVQPGFSRLIKESR